MQNSAQSSESSTKRPMTPNVQKNINAGEKLSLKDQYPADYWNNFVCTYCSKSFPSPQSLGGHQNAHRKERNEEKMLYAKSPFSYGKGPLLRPIRPLNHHCFFPVDGPAKPAWPAYGPLRKRYVVEGNEGGTSRAGLGVPAVDGYNAGFPYRAGADNIENINNSQYHSSNNKHVNNWKSKTVNLDLNLFLPLPPPPSPRGNADYVEVGGVTNFLEGNYVSGRDNGGAKEGNNTSQLLDLTLKL